MHKRECKKRAAEIFDEALFKQPPPNDECPICMLRLPIIAEDTNYYACCGKTLCMGCIHADRIENSRTICPFCRTPWPTSAREALERLKKRAEGDDADGMNTLGYYYCNGSGGLPRDDGKANKLFLRAGQLGHSKAYGNLASSYERGEGVEKDMMKAKHYWELAAMRGDAGSRYNLGVFEERTGNMSRAVKHWMLAAGAGYDESLKTIRGCFLKGHATKDDFEKALRAHKDAKDETKSDQREAAAAYYNEINSCNGGLEGK